MSMKNSNYTIENRTRDLPARSTVLIVKWNKIFLSFKSQNKGEAAIIYGGILFMSCYSCFGQCNNEILLTM